MGSGLKLLVLLLLAGLFLPVAASGAGQSGEIWFFQGDRIPAPPQQKQAWQPPATDIPAEYIGMVVTAFAHGLADPRNCEYREVVVPMGNDAFGGFYRVKTHGWLLPRSEEHSPPFAILWNGLVYPVISTGATTSVEEDIQSLIAYTIQRNAMFEDNLTVPESERLKFPGLFPVESFNYGAVCALLLRLGEAKLAEKIYHAAIEKRGVTYPNFWNNNVQTFAVWTLFSRALAAHMYGDDKLALCYAEQYEPLIDDKEKFAASARKLLAEQRRRAGERPVAKNRIDALILDLENVDERQNGQPGGVILGNDKHVQALIAVGDAAVEPLLECLENDPRLTRSVSFHRDFFPQRTIITVADAAYVALSGILQQSFFHARSTSDNLSLYDVEYRQKIAQQIREHYNRYRNMSYPDKWYHILLNNDESIGAQLQATENICRERNVKVIPNSAGISAVMMSTDHTSRGRSGEILRSKRNPSVSELLNRRAVEYLPRNESAIASSWAFDNAKEMATLSAEWDLLSSLPALQAVSNAIYRELPKYDKLKSERIYLLVSLTIQRFKAGDKAALQQYCETLLANPESVLGKNCNSLWEWYLQPLHTFPQEAIVVATAEEIFNSPGTVWSKYFGEFKDVSRVRGWQFAEFMRLSPYQKHVRNGLRDQTGIIKMQTVITGSRIDFRSESLDGSGSGSGSYGYSADDVKNAPLFPGNHSTQILRVCDVYAKALSELKNGGYPAFQNYWNEKDRDRAIEAIASRLSQRAE